MKNQKKKKKKQKISEPYPYCELGISEKDWQITINFTKGILSGNRGVVIEVVHLKSGKRKRKSVVTKTKTQSRQAVLPLARKLLDELRK